MLLSRLIDQFPECLGQGNLQLHIPTVKKNVFRVKEKYILEFQIRTIITAITIIYFIFGND